MINTYLLGSMVSMVQKVKHVDKISYVYKKNVFVDTYFDFDIGYSVGDFQSVQHGCGFRVVGKEYDTVEMGYLSVYGRCAIDRDNSKGDLWDFLRIVHKYFEPNDYGLKLSIETHETRKLNSDGIFAATFYRAKG